jgi:hypothetical protein
LKNGKLFLRKHYRVKYKFFQIFTFLRILSVNNNKAMAMIIIIVKEETLNELKIWTR